MKILNREFAKNKFCELNDLKFDIQHLMAIFQNPVPISEDDLTQFDDMKNGIVNELNRISMDLKLEWEKTK